MPSLQRVGLLAGDARDEIATVEDRRRLRRRDELRGVLAARVGRDHAVLEAEIADAPHQRARVEAGDAGHVPAREERAERFARAPVARLLEDLLHDERREERPRRLVVLGVDPDVADLGVGHRHDLPGVGRIGEDLLVAGHARVEADLARGDGLGAEGGAAVDGAVRERERRGLRELARAHGSSTPRSTSQTSTPPTSVAIARPIISRPAHGELRLFEKPFAGS